MGIHLADIMSKKVENSEWPQEDFRNNIADTLLKRHFFTLFIVVKEMNDVF